MIERAFNKAGHELGRDLTDDEASVIVGAVGRYIEGLPVNDNPRLRLVGGRGE